MLMVLYAGRLAHRMIVLLMWSMLERFGIVRTIYPL